MVKNIGQIQWIEGNYMNAMIIGTVEYSVLAQLIKRTLTDKINDRGMFMKGIDYSSYYYEE